MALLGSEDALSKTIQTYIKANAPKSDTAALQALGDGLAKAIIEHLLKFAEVATGIPVLTTGGSGATSTPGKLT